MDDPHPAGATMPALTLFVAALAFLAAESIVFAMVVRRLDGVHRRSLEDSARAMAGLRLLFDEADDALIVNSAEGAILEANRYTLAMFGIPDRRTALSLKVSDFSSSKEDMTPVLVEYWKRAISGEKLSFEWETRGPGGDALQVETIIKPIDWGGKTAILSTMRDLSKRKAVEKERDFIQSQLFQIQKMDALSRLAGGFAHDFNNVLTGIMGSLSVLKMMNDNSAQPEKGETGRYLLTALDSCARAGDLVRQLLTLSRREENKLVKVDLKASLSHVVQICRNSFPKSISIDYRESENGPMLVMGDQAQLEQAFLNVCINAYQAMTVMNGREGSEGGELRVDVQKTDPDVRRPGLLPELSLDCHYALISIADTGVGISGEAQKRLFEPFFTTKSKSDGSGLGLSIVYSIMKQHSGSVEIRSTQGRGTTVSLYLPLLEKAGGEVLAAAEQPPVKGEGLVLVVDDENAVRISAEGLLKLCGYEVLAADSGQAGIDVFRDRWRDISLVLLDVSMPGKSGMDVLQEIVAIDPGVRVVMMSGFVENEGINQALGTGALAFLHKPFTMRNLAKTVKGVLELRRD